MGIDLSHLMPRQYLLFMIVFLNMLTRGEPNAVCGDWRFVILDNGVRHFRALSGVNPLAHAMDVVRRDRTLFIITTQSNYDVPCDVRDRVNVVVDLTKAPAPNQALVEVHVVDQGVPQRFAGQTLLINTNYSK